MALITKNINDYLRDNYVPTKDGVHDLTDQASITTPITIAPADGWVKYANDGAAYEYGNVVLYDKINQKVDCSALPLDNNMVIDLKTAVETATSSTYILVKCVIPQPAGEGGEIHVKTKTIEVDRQNIVYDKDVTFHVYNGAPAKAYGFEFYTMVVNNNVEFSNRRAKIGA